MFIIRLPLLLKYVFCPLIYSISPQLIRQMKGSPSVSTTPIPPVDFMSSTLGSDLGATLLSEDDEDLEEEERYAMVSKNLCSFEYTPGHTVDSLEGSGMFLHILKQV